MRLSRRDFIRTGGKTLLGGAIVLAVPAALGSLVSLASRAYGRAGPLGEAPEWRFIIDIRKCIGCGRCVRACKLENDVPPEPEYSRTWVERYVITEDEEVLVDSPDAGIHGFADDHIEDKYGELDIRRSFFVPKLCNQCASPPCVTVCPVGANYTTREGVVLIDRNACIGCGYCVQACPFGARFFDPRLHIVDKCTWCYHRVTHGDEPACVYVCPAGARTFGDVSDDDEEVSRLLGRHTVTTLKPDLGCEAKVYYIGMDHGVR